MPRPLKSPELYSNEVWRLWKTLMDEGEVTLSFSSPTAMLYVRRQLYSFARSLVSVPKPQESISRLEWGRGTVGLSPEDMATLLEITSKAVDTARDFFVESKEIEGSFIVHLCSKSKSKLATLIREAMGWESTEDELAKAIAIFNSNNTDVPK